MSKGHDNFNMVALRGHHRIAMSHFAGMLTEYTNLETLYKQSQAQVKALTDEIARLKANEVQLET